MAIAGPTLQPWQWGVLVLAYVLFFLLPAIWLARKARRDGEPPFVWVMLTLVGSLLGVFEYYHYRGMEKAKARKAARRQAAVQKGEVGPGSRGPRGTQDEAER